MRSQGGRPTSSCCSPGYGRVGGVTVRAVVVADTDSYVKWGATLVGTAPWESRVVVLDGHVAPSARQIRDALVGTDVDPGTVDRVRRAGLRTLLRTDRPDVLVLAVRAHAVPAVLGLLDDVADRPVVVTGVAGICVPVQWYDVNLRRGTDLYLVHSRRERRDLLAVAARHGVRHRVALGTLPFLRVAAGSLRAVRGTVRTRTADGPVVFAPQSLVPAGDADRERVLRGLAAAVGPDREVHVKVRSRHGEAEAHRGAGDYTSLLERLHAEGAVPSGLRVVDGPMAEHLERASGFVTIGSSAVLEAVAGGVPSVVLGDLGVDDAHLNAVFVGSGLLGSLDDVAHGRFRRVDPAWAADNYFHDPADDDWLQQVEQLLVDRALRGLPLPQPVPATLGNRVRGVYYRLDAVAPWRGTPLAPLERAVLGLARWLNRRVLHLR